MINHGQEYYEEFYRCLTELIDLQAFELQPSFEGPHTWYIPYMMNDSIEYYFVLKNCRTVGNYLPESTEPVTAQFHTPSDQVPTPLLVVCQGQENLFTIWFETLERVQNCYAYHAIGHFWMEGQEQWRQLVYILGTIYDKYLFIGKEACNQTELEIMKLMECAPFRCFSPIRESMENRYPDTEDGLQYFIRLASESGNMKLKKALERFQIILKLPGFADQNGFLYRMAVRMTAGKMLSSENESTYCEIRKKIVEASSCYPERDYGEPFNSEIQANRDHIASILNRYGFEGTYPSFKKGRIHILAAEEHPFTVPELEYDDIPFRIRFMISESDSDGINSGFFRKPGSRGYVIHSFSELQDRFGL